MIPDLSPIYDNLKKNFEIFDTSVIEKSMEIAVKVHKKQKRISGEPYFIHPFRVGVIVSEMGLDTDVIAAAILHDVNPESEIFNEIEREISPITKFYVKKLTEVRKIRPKNANPKEEEGYRKMVLSVSEDLRVVLIRIADRLDNMRTIDALPDEKQLMLAKEVRTLYVPLANRMGLQVIKSELETRCFSVLESEDFISLQREVQNIEKSRKSYVDEVVSILKNKINGEGISPKIYGRPKHLYSIYLKMVRGKKTLDQIHDILGFRIITDTPRHCYEILGIIHGFLKPVSGLFKDYIAVPKPNGYQSLHTTVLGPGEKRIEIQIRTKEMHDIAEKGVAAHWLYKERYRKTRLETGRFRAIRNTADIIKGETNENYWSLESFQSEIFVFTPQNKLIVLPKDSTPLDFAFAVHSQVGFHCVGAKVNGSMISLKSKIDTWDKIDILTSQNQHPNADWLDIVTTSKAKNKIKHYIRTVERENSRKAGREKVEKELKKLKVSYSRLLKEKEFIRASHELKFMNEDDLFMAIGEGKLSTDKLFTVLIPDLIKKDIKTESDKKKKKKKKRIPKSGPPIEIDGLINVMLKLAKCCTPLPGDDIEGFVTRGRGITIHKKSCNRIKSFSPDRIVKAKWLIDPSAGDPVLLKVVSDNKSGLLLLMSEVFVKAGINISKLHSEELKSKRTATFFHFNATKPQSDLIVRNLRKIRGIYSVSRSGKSR